MRAADDLAGDEPGPRSSHAGPRDESRSGTPVLRLRNLLMAEQERWFLFAPVAVAIGIACFFALPATPPLWWMLPAAVVAGLAIVAAWRIRDVQPVRMLAVLAIGLVLLGYLAAALRLWSVEAPILPRAGTYRLEGTIVELQPTATGARLLLADLSIERLEPDSTPALVRVTARTKEPLRTGDRVRLLARLQRPQGPALPGGFDYARQAYFQRLGALGFAYGKVERLGEAGVVPLANLTNPLRERIAERIVSLWPGPPGQMSAALLTGLDAGIDQSTWRDMQRSGLAHLISISGLHMTIVAGTMFLVLRYGLALIPALALRIPVRKLAAIGAIAAVTIYVLISDGSVPAVRSWLMVLVAFMAIILERDPFSLRLLAFAALVVLLFRPESLLGASFQLSFAAVLALMAAYEAGAARLTRSRREDPPAWQGPALYLAGAIVSTVIATAATTPLSAFHFQNVTTYGALANLVAIPLSTFVTMPAGMLGLALMPLGLDQPAFLVMNASVWVILAVAHLAAGLPGAALLVAQASPLAVLLFGLGMVWLCLWQRRWRMLGILPLLASLVLITNARGPDLVVQPYFDLAAVRTEDGLSLLTRQRSNLVRASWLRAEGLEHATPFPPAFAGAAGDIACDAGGCMLARDGRRIALDWRADAVAEDCGRVDLVIAAVGPERCPTGDAALIGPMALRASEGISLDLEGGAMRLRRVVDERGAWPWTWRPGNRAVPPAPTFESEAVPEEDDLPGAAAGPNAADE